MLERWDLSLADGTNVTVRCACAPSATDRLFVLCPGMGVHARYYKPFLNELRATGWQAVAIDPPGQGESGPCTNRAGYGYLYLATKVLPQVVHQLTNHLGCTSYVLGGHSAGGHWLLNYLALLRPDLTHPGAAGAVLIGAGAGQGTTRTTQDAIRFLMKTRLAVAATKSLGSLPGAGIGVGGRLPYQLLRDWGRVARSGQLSGPGSPADVDAVLRRVQTPVLSVDLPKDPWASQADVDNLLAKLANSCITRTSIDAPAGHSKWARNPDSIVTEINNWAEPATNVAAPPAEPTAKVVTIPAQKSGAQRRTRSPISSVVS